MSVRSLFKGQAPTITLPPDVSELDQHQPLTFDYPSRTADFFNEPIVGSFTASSGGNVEIAEIGGAGRVNGELSKTYRMNLYGGEALIVFSLQISSSTVNLTGGGDGFSFVLPGDLESTPGLTFYVGSTVITDSGGAKFALVLVNGGEMFIRVTSGALAAGPATIAGFTVTYRQ